MPEPKSTPRIPDFSIDDIHRRFACWLQQRCRERPGFENEIADITYCSPSTVAQWRSSQRPGGEAMLRALAYAGPRAISEVLLEPMGMTGARWVEDAPIEGGLCAARRELDDVIDRMSLHPSTPAIEAGTSVLIDVMDRVTTLLRLFTDLRRVRRYGGGGAEIVEMPERERRA